MPRPGTPVIPPGALELHRQVSSSASVMPYQVTIADPDQQGPLNPDTGQLTVIPGVVAYTDLPARLFPVPLNERQIDHADQPEQTSRWYMRLPLGTVVAQNQRVTVTAGDENYADVTLVGRTFRVLDPTPRVFATELRITLREEPVPRAT